MHSKDYLKFYIKENICPILTDIVDSNFFDCLILNKENDLIIGDKKFIVIENFDELSIKEQDTYKELLKGKKYKSIDIKDHVRIILTSKKIDLSKISENILPYITVVKKED